MIKLKI